MSRSISLYCTSVSLTAIPRTIPASESCVVSVPGVVMGACVRYVPGSGVTEYGGAEANSLNVKVPHRNVTLVAYLNVSTEQRLGKRGDRFGRSIIRSYRGSGLFGSAEPCKTESLWQKRATRRTHWL
ncbi:hypothetical protein CBL_14432 [Carabus blaptoides fortunei]